MKDWMVRALKTFVQAFFGVLIPELCAMLRNGWPESWDKVWVILAPVIAAALAAAIAAVWNIILEAMREAPEECEFAPFTNAPVYGQEVPDADEAKDTRQEVDEYLGLH